MALSNNLERRMPSDIAHGFGIATRPFIAKPIELPPAKSTLPVVNKMSLIAKGEPIPTDGEIITREPDGSIIVALPTAPNDEISKKLMHAIENPEPVRLSDLPSTDNPIVNLRRFFGRIAQTAKTR